MSGPQNRPRNASHYYVKTRGTPVGVAQCPPLPGDLLIDSTAESSQNNSTGHSKSMSPFHQGSRVLSDPYNLLRKVEESRSKHNGCSES